MKLFAAATAALSVLALSSAALAAPAAITATLASPLAKEKSVVAAGAAWRCAESTCRLASDSTVEVYAACRALAKQVGEVTAIGTAEKPLEAERLAKCN